DPKASHDAWKFMLDFASARAVICSGDLFKTFADFQQELEGLKKTIAFESIDDLCGKYSGGYGGENVKPDDVLEILFTSGTTGDPKAVMLTHGNVLSNVEDIYTVLELSPDDRAFSILPIHHVYESTGGLMNAAYNGCSTFFARGIKPREMLEDLRRAGPTYWSTSPLILEKMFVRIRKQLESMAPSGTPSGEPPCG
ncbi:MAG: AMP-binding protein, partial [Acidobacteria bacterium]|nr:AMP-binding protein [Acidobacteriota bacterium]